MSYCYKDTSQMSELDVYEFKLPKYPESTTDPTYYEPQATRIANMKKSASSSKALYDFTGELPKDSDKAKVQALKDLDSAQVDPRFNNYLTREEISQVTTNMAEHAEKIVSDKKQEKKDKESALAEAVKLQTVLEQTTTQNNNTSEE